MKRNTVPAAEPTGSGLGASHQPGKNSGPRPMVGFAANRANLYAIASVGITELTKASSVDSAARLHGYHSMMFVITAFAGHAALSLLGVFATFIPLYDLACFAGFAFLLWRAWQGRPSMFPILSSFARKQAGGPAQNGASDTLQ